MSSVRLVARPPEQVREDPALRRSAAALVAVGGLFLVLQQVLVPRPMGLSIDEVTYLAKVDPEVPELFWTEVRAWGMPLLAAPVGVFSAGTGVVRFWFSVLSSAGLVAAFWPWRRVLHPAVAPLAALLLATCWYTLSFGFQVMPNLYVGLGAVATTGLYLRAVQTGRRVHLLGTGAAAGFVALVRPTDNALVLVGIAACALALPRLRRTGPLLALAVGSAVGWLPWVVEAYVRFDGPLARLRGGNEAGLKGGMTFNLINVQTYPRILDGSPAYCCYGEPASEAGPLPVLFTAWYLAVPLLVILGLLAAHRLGRLPETAVALVPGALLAFFYLFMLPFASARFLIPITALLALPVAVGLVAVGVRRGAALGLAAVVVAGHLGLMLREASRELPETVGNRQLNVRVAQGVRPFVPTRPCVVVGDKPQVRSYYLGCSAEMLLPATAEPPPLVRSVLAQGGSVVAVLDRPPPRGSYVASWRSERVPGAPRRWRVYVPPG